MHPARKKGTIAEDDVKKWLNLAYVSCSTRSRLWCEGVAEGTGWPLENVCLLDHIMEYGIYQAKLHSFAGCTSIFSWGGHSADGNMYVGRNMDWSETFNKFPQVLTVRKPSDGSYKVAYFGWRGM